MTKKMLLLLLIFSITVFAEMDKTEIETIARPAERELGESGIDISQLPDTECDGIQILGVNRDDRLLLDRTTWAVMPGMTLDCINSESSPVLINFTTRVNDRVANFYGGLLEIRLLRDGEEIRRTETGFSVSPLFNDLTASLTFTDEPEAGEHTYTVEYRLSNSGYRAFSVERNMQIYTK